MNKWIFKNIYFIKFSNNSNIITVSYVLNYDQYILNTFQYLLNKGIKNDMIL